MGRFRRTAGKLNAGVWAFSEPQGSGEIFVLGADGNLWFEEPPFGTVPPARQQVDQNVRSFRLIEDSTQNLLALGVDGNLWLEQGPFGKAPPTRQQIDRGGVLPPRPQTDAQNRILRIAFHPPKIPSGCAVIQDLDASRFGGLARSPEFRPCGPQAEAARHQAETDRAGLP